MTTDRHFTSRPFTVAACATCAADITQTVMPRLREVVRNCPHAVLVVTDRLLGRLADSSMGSGRGVLLALQPCGRPNTAVGCVLGRSGEYRGAGPQRMRLDSAGTGTGRVCRRPCGWRSTLTSHSVN